MDQEALITYLLEKPGVVKEYPFGEWVLVFKVSGKIYALLAENEDPLQISLKCEPELAEELRAVHACVRPGYHLNKRHWNTITLDGSLEEEELRQMIDHSYERVVMGLTKAQRTALSALSV